MQTAPLSERLRPTSLQEFVGQDHLFGDKGIITRLIEGKKPLSILLWGPPGCGKTTLARLYAKAFEAEFIPFSAVFQGIQELKKIVEDVKKHPLFQKTSILFIDEIHRFTKAQQDALLPLIEDGTFILVGATTENPSFALNPALLSRLRVLTLGYLSTNSLEKIFNRYETLSSPLPLTSEAKNFLIEAAQGDGRYLLNLIEQLQTLPRDQATLGLQEIAPLLQKRSPLYDKQGEHHYNLISALHKAVRGSDPDAALYYLARMLEGGEAPDYLGRRIVRMAVEDVGLADPEALALTLNAWRAYDQLGSPEGDLALAEAVIYLALAPKSNSAYAAFSQAKKIAATTSHLPPPSHILNAPTSFMKEQGVGKGYMYDHDCPDAFSGQNYFPDKMDRPSFYHPVERGFEKEMKRRVEYFSKLREKKERGFS